MLATTAIKLFTNSVVPVSFSSRKLSTAVTFDENAGWWFYCRAVHTLLAPASNC